MSGWKRLGMVLSIMWLIGYPVNEIITNELKLAAQSSACRDAVYRAFILDSDMSNVRLGLEHCDQRQMRDREAWWESYWDMIMFRVNNPVVSGIMWFDFLYPVVLLWLVGGTIIGTSRWVIRRLTTAPLYPTKARSAASSLPSSPRGNM